MSCIHRGFFFFVEVNVYLAVDSETHLIAPGRLIPKGVCGSVSDGKQHTLLPFEMWLDRLRRHLMDDTVLAGANIAYDFAVAAAAQPDLLHLIFEKLERGEVHDVQHAAALDAIADGTLGYVPWQAAPVRYSLEVCTRLVTGRTDAKANDEWRLRYAELDGVPMSEWPEAAKIYPLDDAANTWEVAAIQAGIGDSFQPAEHEWVDEKCANCGVEVSFGTIPPCTKMEDCPRAKNCGPLIRGYRQPHPLKITHLTREARAAWALHLACAWGLRTDPVAVAAFEEKVEAQAAEDEAKFLGTDIVRPDGTKDMTAIRRRVLKAYGAKDPCLPCGGSGRVPTLTKTGKPSKNGAACDPCDGTGLAFPKGVPTTEKGGISTSRDTLSESGDEFLEAFAHVSENAKLKTTYLPFLKTGTEVPITLRANVILDSDRTSYDGVIQLLPRKGGVRECFVPRPGMVFASVDYGALELCTLAQVCLWTVGYSHMAEVINETKDPGSLHTRLGARFVGADPRVFGDMVKAGVKEAKATRQKAKIGNFGFAGGMGEAKLVLSQRKEGLSFCGGPCGETKVTEWKDRPISPTCLACIEVAAQLRSAWFDEWSEMRDYFRWIAQIPGIDDGRGVVVSPGTGFVRGGLHFSQAANHCFQHLAAAGAKHALWLVSRECYDVPSSPLFGSRPVLFAHDEIIAEMPEDRAHEAAHRLSELMVKGMREFVPDVHIVAEPALMRRWWKAAEPVYANGRLVPWEPKP